VGAVAAVASVAGRGVPGRRGRAVLALIPRERVTSQAPSGGRAPGRGPVGAALQAAGAQRVDQETLVGAAQRTFHPGKCLPQHGMSCCVWMPDNRCCMIHSCTQNDTPNVSTLFNWNQTHNMPKLKVISEIATPLQASTQYTVIK